MRQIDFCSTMIFIVFAIGIFVPHPHGRADEPKAESSQHLGTWRMVAVVVNGQNVPVGLSTLMDVGADGWTVTTDGKSYAKGTTKHDPKSPSQSEVTYTEGDLAGKTLQQISKIEGDVMIACAGVKRPTEFKSQALSGHTLSVWIRVK